MDALQQTLNFRKATRQQAKASIAIQGLSGDGKSGVALALGYYLADEDWDSVFAIDTENKSLDLFQGIRMHTGQLFGEFNKVDLLPMHGYAPTTYLKIRENALKAGGKVIINDSLSHCWQYKGGVLQLVTSLEEANKKVNKFNAWAQPDVVREKNAIFDCVRSSDIHVISTIRVKEKFEQVYDGQRSTINSLGEQQIMMPDFKYEPDLVLEVVSPGTTLGAPPVVEIKKTRYDVFIKGQRYELTKDMIIGLKDYLAVGADPEVLKEAQRKEIIETITNILDSDPSKKTMYPHIKESIGCGKDVKLKDMSILQVKTLLGILIN